MLTSGSGAMSENGWEADARLLEMNTEKTDPPIFKCHSANDPKPNKAIIPSELIAILSCMVRRLTLLCSAALALVLPEQVASNDASRYCVRPITIDKIEASMPYAQSEGPSKLKFSFEASTPFPVDNVRDPPDADRYYSREVFWYIQPDYRLVGPISIPERRVLGTDGTLVYLLESERQTDNDGIVIDRNDRIWSLAADGTSELVEGPWTDAKWKLSLESGQSGAGKIVLVGWPQEPESSEHQSYFGLKDGRVEFWGEDRPFIPAKSFPEFGFAVDEAFGLSLKSNMSDDTHKLSLPHTSEHGWWESINIDRYGWLFAEGYGNDYAIKLSFEEDLSVDRVHRFTGRGWFGRVVEWLFGIGPETDIAATQWSSQCVDYSPALRLTLFCDPAKVLREGVLQDFPDHLNELDRYIGDASGAGVALVKGQNNELYAFNGDAIQLVSDNMGSFVRAQDVPAARRTFVTSGNGAYELEGSFPNLTLSKLADRENGPEATHDTEGQDQAFRGMTFMSAPDSGAVLGFNQNSIWHFGESSNEQIWQSSNVRIVTSEVAPVADWRGLMFLTSDSQANVIEQCPI